MAYPTSCWVAHRFGADRRCTSPPPSHLLTTTHPSSSYPTYFSIFICICSAASASPALVSTPHPFTNCCQSMCTSLRGGRFTHSWPHCGAPLAVLTCSVIVQHSDTIIVKALLLLQKLVAILHACLLLPPLPFHHLLGCHAAPNHSAKSNNHLSHTLYLVVNRYAFIDPPPSINLH